jgi:uncharacterized membrane protein
MNVEQNAGITAGAREIRTVDAGRGLEWVTAGFRAVMQHPGPWILGTLALGVVMLIIRVILPSLLSSPLNSALGMVALGVAARWCVQFEAGVDPVPETSRTASLQPLWVLGALSAAASFAVVMIMFLMAASSAGIGYMVGGQSSMFAGIMLAALVGLVLYVIVGMALWLAPALVVLDGIAPVDAMKLSFAATMRNPGAYVVFSLLAIGASIVGTIFLLIGLLFVIPALACAAYAAYRDIFA